MKNIMKIIKERAICGKKLLRETSRKKNTRAVCFGECAKSKYSEAYGPTIIQRSESGEFLGEWNNISSVARFTKVSRSTVVRRIEKRLLLNGYIWEWEKV